VPAGSTIRCPSCGSPTAATAEFCRRCGNDLTSPGALPLLTARDDAAEQTEVIDQYGRGELASSAIQPGSHGRSRPLVGALVAVLGLGLLGAGGYGGYRAVREGRTSPPTASAAPPAATPTARSSEATPSTRPTGTTPSGSPAPLVAAAPALTERPETAEVVRLLTTYFDAINTRNFAAARKALVDRPGLPQNQAEFSDQFRSTHDQDVRLLGLRPDGNGGYLASVSFTSYQNPADAPDHTSACLIWSMAYPLVRVDGALLIDAVRRSGVIYRRC
jgi:zinc-ribbon domain